MRELIKVLEAVHITLDFISVITSAISHLLGKCNRMRRQNVQTRVEPRGCVGVLSVHSIEQRNTSTFEVLNPWPTVCGLPSVWQPLKCPDPHNPEPVMHAPHASKPRPSQVFVVSPTQRAASLTTQYGLKLASEDARGLARLPAKATFLSTIDRHGDAVIGSSDAE